MTGTAHGIGSAIAAALRADGATVTRRGQGRRRPDQRRRRCTRFFAAVGDVDILVNNAGGVCGQVGQPLEEVSEQDWHAVVDANLTSAFLCTRAVVPAHEAARLGPDRQHLLGGRR